jgi:hypothetical protein
MSAIRITTGKGNLEKVLAEAREKEKSYRERALKMYPWICAKCGREFDGKRLKELTVHHRDHNHDNNPPDGSNWELLCLYCHDNEHSRDQVSDWYSGGSVRDDDKGSLGNNPFKGLDALLKLKEKEAKSK